jgi:serine protease
MRYFLLAVASALTALAPSSALAQERGTVPGRALVLLKPTQASVRASASAVIAAHGLRRAASDVPEVGVMSVRLPAGSSVAELRRRLARDPRVATVEAEPQHELRLVPNDPALTAPDATIGDVFQWYLHRQGFPAAWDLSRGTGAVVGIIDSGIDSAHPDIAGKVKSAHDHDGNAAGTGDEVGHGTHVSGLACGAADNGFGIAGAGLDCQVVLEKSDLTGSSVVASLVDATKLGSGVINMSFGGGRLSAGETRALRYALRNDVVLIAAAADQPIPEQGHPAKDLQPTGTGSNIRAGEGLVVTAADPTGGRASFAGRGSQISLAAMGDSGTRGGGIFSSFPANPTQIETGGSNPPGPPCPSCRTVFNGDSRFAYLAGTSMAAPQVAGAVALVRAANPKLRRTAVVRIMKQTATRAAGASGWTTELGWGILNAGAAVQRAVQLAGDTVPPQTSRRGGRSRRVGRRFTLTWRGRDSAPPGVPAAGVESYSIYEKRGKRYLLIATTTSTRYRLRGRRGKRYRFVVRARDLAGNFEPTRRASFLIRVRR